jgi:hypothetical protein
MDDARKSPVMLKGIDLCAKVPPKWERGHLDYPYWYFGSLAFYQVGGAAWQRWNAALQTALYAGQDREGTPCHQKGSWPPDDPWSPEGGRVYSTALACLALATPTRYERFLKPKEAK